MLRRPTVHLLVLSAGEQHDVLVRLEERHAMMAHHPHLAAPSLADRPHQTILEKPKWNMSIIALRWSILVMAYTSRVGHVILR